MLKLYKRPQPTETWLINKLIEMSSEGYRIIAELDKKNKVIIKLTVADKLLKNKRYDDRNEYKIYQLLDKLSHKNPNIPKLYGQMSCYEKKHYLENMEKKLIDKGLCNGKEDDIKVYFTVMEYYTDAVQLDRLPYRLNKIQTLSIIWQGLYQIYMLIYVFGILQSDYNPGNILIRKTSKSQIEYNILNAPYRFFDFEFKHDGCNSISTAFKVPTNGIQLILIDFDQARCYHHKYLNVVEVSVSEHVIKHAYSFITSVCSYGDQEILKICTEHFESRGKHLMEYSKQFFNRYNKEKNEPSSWMLIDRLKVTYRMWLRELHRKVQYIDGDYLDLC